MWTLSRQQAPSPSHVLGGLPQGGFARIPVCNHHHHHHGLGGGGGDDLVTTISPCRRLAVRPKMSGLRPHDWTWRLAATVANLHSIVSVSICFFVSGVIVIIECHCHY